MGDFVTNRLLRASISFAASRRRRGISAETVEVPLKDPKIVEFNDEGECPEDHPLYSAIT